MAGLLEVYGLGASLQERHGETRTVVFFPRIGISIRCTEWSGTVGTTLGFFCGIALVCLPLSVVYLSLMETRHFHDTRKGLDAQ